MAQMRVTPELFDLVNRTAEHVGLDVSEVIRSICKSIRRGNVVTQKKFQFVLQKAALSCFRCGDWKIPARTWKSSGDNWRPDALKSWPVRGRNHINPTYAKGSTT